MPPVAALFDGLPVQNHQRLHNRLIVRDPEGIEPTYQVAASKHGTEMTSLIVHGDINRAEPPLSQPLYLRPMMSPALTLQGEKNARRMIARKRDVAPVAHSSFSLLTQAAMIVQNLPILRRCGHIIRRFIENFR